MRTYDCMRIIKRGALEQFWQRHPDARANLEGWYGVVRKENWKNPAELKQVYHSADLVGRRTVFNIAGNKYRLIARVTTRVNGFRLVHTNACGISQRGLQRMSTTTIDLDEKTYGKLLAVRSPMSSTGMKSVNPHQRTDAP
jgi:mRNA interferase HigB